MATQASNRLRVLVYHDIPPNCTDIFTEQIRWLKSRWRFIDSETFYSIVTGNSPLTEDSLLLTFDDGFYSNYLVAESVLNPLNIKAIFFVVSGFIDTESALDSRNFIAKSIRSDMTPTTMPSHWRSMSWSDLRRLHASGHTIGAHTATHVRLSELTDNTSIIREIVSSADYIAQKVDSEVNNFAFTFGDFSSLSQNELTIARERFNLIFSSLRGDNATEFQPQMLCRDTISPLDSCWLIGSFLEGSADCLYTKSLDTCRSWLK